MANALGTRLVRAIAEQDEDGGDAENGKHEQRHRGAERDVAGSDAEQERIGREHVGHVARPARRHDLHDVEIGEGDDEREQHGDGDDVAHHR